ncbi:MAG: AraC family transcriptional regulator [Candidatus Dormibacteria bacterium]
MSQDRQSECWSSAGAGVIVVDFPMESGDRFEWHSHTDHQLAWGPRGVLIVSTDPKTYVLPPSRGLWIPAGVGHETGASGAATLRSLYLRPGMCPIPWRQATPVAVGALVAELIGYLDDASLAQAPRVRAESVLYDLLTPVATSAIEVRMPPDPRARRVAEGLVADPSDQRRLAAWGRSAGASERTLARAFLTGTGLPFARWRRLVRIQASLPHLAHGRTVAAAAALVGYETPSAFVAAFRRETGLTPGAYFRSPGP